MSEFNPLYPPAKGPILDNEPTVLVRPNWPSVMLNRFRRLFGIINASRAPRTHQATVVLSSDKTIHQVDARFLSFSIDISVLAGGFWWEGSSGSRRGLGTRRVEPLNLNNAKLDILTKALAPAYLRIGGSEADKIHYFFAPEDEVDALVLTQSTWDALHQFKARNQLNLAFTVKYGLFKRALHGHWRGTELQRLLKYSLEQNYTIDVCELGNELNAYWAFHGLASQPRAHHLARDYHHFAETIKTAWPEAKIIGPGSAFWPKLGETIKPFSNITKKFLEACQHQQTPLDIVDWHYYPFQSLRSPVRTRTASIQAMLKPRALNDFKKYSQQLKAWRDLYFPSAQLWTGETGSAQCGGEPKLSDRFISCFWWADQLGLAARNGQDVIIRQSLIGGEYGLIDRITLKPRPDYWLTWIWKQLMGNRVYAVDCAHHMLRCYCHDQKGGEGKVLLMINLSSKPIQLQSQGFTEIEQQYTLTAKRLKSRKLRINGQKAKFRNGSFHLGDFPQQPISTILPGYSIQFWLMKTGAPAA